MLELSGGWPEGWTGAEQESLVRRPGGRTGAEFEISGGRPEGRTEAEVETSGVRSRGRIGGLSRSGVSPGDSKGRTPLGADNKDRSSEINGNPLRKPAPSAEPRCSQGGTSLVYGNMTGDQDWRPATGQQD